MAASPPRCTGGYRAGFVRPERSDGGKGDHLAPEEAHRPYRQVIAGAADVEHRAGCAAVGAGQTLEENVVQPPQIAGVGAVLGGPGITQLPRDAAEPGIVHVATDYDAGIVGGVLQNCPELVAARGWGHVSHGAEVGGVDPHEGLADPYGCRGRAALGADEAG